MVPLLPQVTSAVHTVAASLCPRAGHNRSPRKTSGRPPSDVLDPNVIVSAVLSRNGSPARAFRAWIDGAYELVVSPGLLDELERVRGYPKIAARVGSDAGRQLLDLVRRHAELVDDPPVAPIVSSRDPNDDYLIALGASSRAIIVTGDSDLLTLSRRMPVVTPAQFLDLSTL